MQKEIMEIVSDGKLLAIVFSGKLKAQGVKFLTPIDFPLQLGLIEHQKGKSVRPHIHRDLKYNVNTTQEFLYIEKGAINVEIYNSQWDVVENVLLGRGDFILFISGGHAINVVRKCRILEIKQGPYPGDKLAKIFMEAK